MAQQPLRLLPSALNPQPSIAPMRLLSLEGKLTALLSLALIAGIGLTALLIRWWLPPWLAVLGASLVLIPLAIVAARIATAPLTSLLRVLAGSVASFRDGDYSVSLAERRRDEFGDLRACPQRTRSRAARPAPASVPARTAARYRGAEFADGAASGRCQRARRLHQYCRMRAAERRTAHERSGLRGRRRRMPAGAGRGAGDTSGRPVHDVSRKAKKKPITWRSATCGCMARRIGCCRSTASRASCRGRKYKRGKKSFASSAMN